MQRRGRMPMKIQKDRLESSFFPTSWSHPYTLPRLPPTHSHPSTHIHMVRVFLCARKDKTRCARLNIYERAIKSPPRIQPASQQPLDGRGGASHLDPAPLPANEATPTHPSASKYIYIVILRYGYMCVR